MRVTSRLYDATEFLNEISIRNNYFSTPYTDYIFRGQSDSNWTIVPSALRKNTLMITDGGVKKTPLRTIREQVEAEFNMIYFFCHELNKSGLHVPNEDTVSLDTTAFSGVAFVTELGRSERLWPSKEYHSTIALAQHYGVPTRFTDWTYNPYVAAYFAAKDNAIKKTHNQKYGEFIAIFAIDSEEFEFRQFNFEEENSRLSPEKIMEITAKKKLNRFYQIIKAPTFFNDNLKAQRGVFLAYIEKDFRPNDRCKPLSLNHYIAQNKISGCYKFLLHHEAVPELLRLLSKEFINAGSIFPGIKGAVDSVYERSLWDTMM